MSDSASPSTSSPTTTTSSYDESVTSDAKQTKVASEKVVMLFKAVGNAPIMKKSKFKINATSQFDEVIQFIRKTIKLKSDQSLV